MTQIIEVRIPEVVVIDDTTVEVIEVAVQGPAGRDGLGGTTYIHTQSTPAAIWTVAHNLGRRPAVQVVDHLGVLLLADARHDSDDILTITHGSAMIGVVYCI